MPRPARRPPSSSPPLTDRSNLAYASMPLARDLGFTPETYGLGSGVFFAGYAAAMIPSTIILVHAGAARWLGLLVTSWGLVAAGFSLVRNASQVRSLPRATRW